MTILKERTTVKFDANDRAHRRMFAEFKKAGSWGNIPIRFTVADVGPDLITMIQRDMIDFYLQEEFNG